MVRREPQEACAEQRVGPRGEHFDDVVAAGRFTSRQCEADQQPLRAADPIRLHQPHLVRPAVERLKRIEQVFRIVGDLEHPFRLLALLDERARPPAASVDHLLVGEHGLVDRVPIHFPLLAVDEASLEQVEKQLLLLVVVVEVAGRELPAPVERQPHALELAAHGGDVVVGPFGGMDATLDRRVLRRQAERVPAHGVEHVVPAGAHIARNHVAHGVIADMAHMDAPGGVWEHFKNIVFGTRIILARVEQPTALPELLPAWLRFTRIVAIGGHDLLLWSEFAPTRPRKPKSGQSSAGNDSVICRARPPCAKCGHGDPSSSQTANLRASDASRASP